jgi:hypothetical protein
MPIYLTEVHLATASEHELERAVRMLDAAMDRMPESVRPTRTVFVGHSREDGRLICLIEAASVDAARRLVSLALLPPGRFREITQLSGPPWRRRRRRDADHRG